MLQVSDGLIAASAAARSDCYTLFYVRLGQVCVGGVAVSEHEALLIARDIPFDVTGTGEGLTVLFSHDTACRFLLPSAYKNPMLLNFFICEKQKHRIPYLRFSHCPNETEREMNRLKNCAGDETLSCAVLLRALYRLGRGWVSAPISNAPNAEHAQQAIYQMLDFFPSLSLSQISKKTGFHENAVSNMIKRSTGMGFSALAQHMKISVAAACLLGKSCTAVYAAAYVGYTAMNHFYDRFRAVFQCTPTEFAAKGKRL